MLGYPGAGKTTASKEITKITGAEHIWADHIRREAYNPPTYSHEENLELYSKLNNLTEQMLQDGKSVIFDTNFSYYNDRKHLIQIAQKTGAKAVIVWVQTPKGLAKQRAVVDAHLHSHTRVLGHMPEAKFEKISLKIEPLRDSEPRITLDGTKISEDYVRNRLEDANIV